MADALMVLARASRARIARQRARRGRERTARATPVSLAKGVGGLRRRPSAPWMLGEGCCQRGSRDSAKRVMSDAPPSVSNANPP